MRSSAAPSRSLPNPYPANHKQIEGFHNFLSHSAETFINVPVDEEEHGGVAEFELNLEPYTTLIVAVTSEDQCSHLIVPLETGSRINMP